MYNPIDVKLCVQVCIKFASEMYNRVVNKQWLVVISLGHPR